MPPKQLISVLLLCALGSPLPRTKSVADIGRSPNAILGVLAISPSVLFISFDAHGDYEKDNSQWHTKAIVNCFGTSLRVARAFGYFSPVEFQKLNENYSCTVSVLFFLCPANGRLSLPPTG